MKTKIQFFFLFFLFSLFLSFYSQEKDNNFIEKTKIHLIVTVVSNLINLYLNIGLIYGSKGVNSFFSELNPMISFLSFLWVWVDFPALGVKGAAIATLVASIWMAFHYSFYLFSKTVRDRFYIYSLEVNSEIFQKQVLWAYRLVAWLLNI